MAQRLPDTRCINPSTRRPARARRCTPRSSLTAGCAATKRAIANAKNCAKQLLPVETVRRAEAMFAAGVMQGRAQRVQD